jgi:hypothetical protein
MNDEVDDDINGKDSLSQLIRKSRTDKAFLRPTEEAIEAYVYGSPTPLQKREVRSAMTASQEFRREILTKCEEAGALASPEIRDAFDRTIVESYPDLDKLVSDTSSSTETSTSLISQKWVISLATAALLVITVTYLINKSPDMMLSETSVEPESSQPTTSPATSDQSVIEHLSPRHTLSLTVHTAQVEKSLLIASSVLRSGDFSTTLGDTSAFDSAIRSFAKILAIDSNGDFQPAERIMDTVSSEQIGELSRTIVLGAGTNDSTLIRFNVPQPAVGVRVWILSLPSRSLSFSDPQGDTLAIDPNVWDRSENLFITLTYIKVKTLYSTAAQRVLR